MTVFAIGFFASAVLCGPFIVFLAVRRVFDVGISLED